jgi:hypothetical protein
MRGWGLTSALRGAVARPVYQVLLELKRKLVGRDFVRMVSTKPLASALLQSYCRAQDRNFLKDFYYQDDRAEETAFVTLLEAYESKEMGDRVRTLQRGLRVLQDAKDQSANAKAGGRTCELDSAAAVLTDTRAARVGGADAGHRGADSAAADARGRRPREQGQGQGRGTVSR